MLVKFMITNEVLAGEWMEKSNWLTFVSVLYLLLLNKINVFGHSLQHQSSPAQINDSTSKVNTAVSAVNAPDKAINYTDD